MIKVAIHGAKGRLGREIAFSLERSNSFDYVGEITEGYIPECDVIVDVTSAVGVKALLTRLTSQKLIVGATGDLPIEDLEMYARKNAVMLVPNFSIGMRLVYELLETSLRTLDSSWKFSIQDVHHKHKKDSPSGTAKRLSKKIEQDGREVEIFSRREGNETGSHTIVMESRNEKIEIFHSALDITTYADGCVLLINELIKEEYGIQYL